MKPTSLIRTGVFFGAALACVLSTPVHASLLTNGGFEAGLSGWTAVNQVGSEGSFLIQSGTQTPITMTTVPAPPEGVNAAMTDAEGPGSRVLYQDFVVPFGIPGALVTFSLFVNNAAPDFFTPGHLDFASTASDPLERLNQQARVDITTTVADPFSVAAGDVLQNLFQTQPGDPLTFGYTNMAIDVTALLLAHQGETLRLRFAQVDNVFTFNLGVDDANVNVIPEPGTWMLTICAMAGFGLIRRRRHGR